MTLEAKTAEHQPEIHVPGEKKRGRKPKTNGVDHSAPTPLVAVQKKIAIFGTTPSRMEGPVQDDSGWERWTIGPGGKDAHNWERLFEVHGVWPADFRDYLNDLSKVEPPRQIVTLPQPDNAAETWTSAMARWFHTHGLEPSVIEGQWKAVKRYPREAILDRYARRMWFSSSISWLIALAIEEGATDIGLWGIDLESDEERYSQFVGCAHLLDLARMRGVNVHLPNSSGLLRDPAPYPDRNETHLALTFEKKIKWLQNAINTLEPQFDGLRQEAARLEGRLLAWRNPPADIPAALAEAEQLLVNHHGRIGSIAANINQLKGEMNATGFYQKMYVWGHTDPQSGT